MIRTGHKDRIPGTWSFATSAQQVSEALEGVPQYARLVLGFRLSRRSRRFVGDVKSWERSPSAIPVCEVHFYWYSATVGMPNEAIQRGPQWQIRIEAVPRERKPLIGALLRSEGLPLMRQWLDRRGALDVGDRHQGFRLAFDPREEKLSHEEWQRA